MDIQAARKRCECGDKIGLHDLERRLSVALEALAEEQAKISRMVDGGACPWRDPNGECVELNEAISARDEARKSAAQAWQWYNREAATAGELIHAASERDEAWTRLRKANCDYGDGWIRDDLECQIDVEPWCGKHAVLHYIKLNKEAASREVGYREALEATPHDYKCACYDDFDCDCYKRNHAAALAPAQGKEKE